MEYKTHQDKLFDGLIQNLLLHKNIKFIHIFLSTYDKKYIQYRLPTWMPLSHAEATS